MSSFKRSLAIGDIHGNFKSLEQALSRANYNASNDQLIVLGDVADGFNESFEVIDFLEKQPNLICIRGNHDVYVHNWLQSNTEVIEDRWLENRGVSTLKSFREHNLNPNHERFEDFKQFFQNLKPYYLSEQNFVFTHGGIRPYTARVEEVKNKEFFNWDREMWYKALAVKRGREDEPKGESCFKLYSKIFIGHTPTFTTHQQYKSPNAQPLKALNVINIDTGGGWNGKVTVMDVDSEEYWQSDFRTREDLQ